MDDSGSLSTPLAPGGHFRVRVLLTMVRDRWFVRLRWVFVLVALLLLSGERLQTGTFARPRAVMFCVVVLALVNTIWMISGRLLVRESGPGETLVPKTIRRAVFLANAQVAVDQVLLTVLLSYSGGIENPMAMLYLLCVVIAALLFRPLNALLQALGALVLYGGLIIGERTALIAPHVPLWQSSPDLGMHEDWGFVLCGLGVMVAGVFGTLSLALPISSRFEAQEQELHRVNDALRDSRAALEDLQTRRSRFMQTAAHQLKSPLAGIEMLAGLIRDKVAPAESIPGIIDRIIARCEQAMVQVAELLTLARLSDSEPRRDRSVGTLVREVVEHVTARFAERTAAKGLRLQMEIGCQGSVLVAVDGRDLDDCLANLLDNAIKYTPSGGEILVRVAEDQEVVSITVKDTGIGIAEDQVDDLFDPFRRGNLALAANIPGTGLGLTIVREVVEQAGGRISVCSAAGKGAEFVVSFPKRDDRARAQDAQSVEMTLAPQDSQNDGAATRG